jgi:hypothetical protein
MLHPAGGAIQKCRCSGFTPAVAVRRRRPSGGETGSERWGSPEVPDIGQRTCAGFARNRATRNRDATAQSRWRRHLFSPTSSANRRVGRQGLHRLPTTIRSVSSAARNRSAHSPMCAMRTARYERKTYYLLEKGYIPAVKEGQHRTSDRVFPAHSSPSSTAKSQHRNQTKGNASPEAKRCRRQRHCETDLRRASGSGTGGCAQR